MNYGSVLKQTWQTIWKFKILWLFGILASCTGFHGSPNHSPVEYRQQMPASVENFIRSMPDWQMALLAGLAIVVLLGVVVAAIFLATVGRIGLIRGAVQADGGRERLTFSELFSGSLPYFWRVFGLNVIVGLILFGAVVGGVVLAGVTTVATLGLFLVCLIPSLCLLLPLGGLIDVWITQANIAMVVDNLGIGEALGRGWNMLTRHFGALVVMALILTLGVGLIGGSIIGLPFFGILAATLIKLMQSGNFYDLRSVWFGLVCLAVYLPVLIVLVGVLSSFVEVAWTLTYLRLTGRPGLEPAPVKIEPVAPAPVEPAPVEPAPVEPPVIEEARPGIPEADVQTTLPPAPDAPL